MVKIIIGGPTQRKLIIMSTEAPIQQKIPSDIVPASKGLLINRNFALLAIGQAISNMGDFVYSTTLLVWVFVLTHSAAAVRGVLISQYAPVFLLGPLAGGFVHRRDRRRQMDSHAPGLVVCGPLAQLRPL